MRHALPLVVLALALASCGGGGGDRLSREEFEQRANRICADFNSKIEALEEPQSVEDIPEFVREARPAFEDTLAELRDLEPPEELQERYDRFLDTGDGVLTALDDLEEAGESGDEAEVTRVAERADQQDQNSDRLARDIGLDTCASD